MKHGFDKSYLHIDLHPKIYEIITGKIQRNLKYIHKINIEF